MSTESLRLAQARSLAFHRAIAERLREEPDLVERARQRVAGWLREGNVAEPYASAWNALLQLPLEALISRMTEPGDRAHDLRQTSPFAGVLDPRARWRIHRSVREDLKHETR